MDGSQLNAGLGPGSVIGGRYTVSDRLTVAAGHETWAATDTYLHRDVVLRAFPSDASYAAAALDAARRAAAIEDPRLVRVVDVSIDDAISCIIEEALTEGRTLTDMLGDGPLPAEDARRLVGEAATALARALSRGLHHLTLGPDDILELPDGQVKLRGLATQAALAGIEQHDADAASRADATALVAVLYAGLTGRWAGHTESSLPCAPIVNDVVVAPGEIVAGVPDDLSDLITTTFVDDAPPATPVEVAKAITPWTVVSIGGHQVRTRTMTGWDGPISGPSDLSDASAASSAQHSTSFAHDTPAYGIAMPTGDTSMVSRPQTAAGSEDATAHLNLGEVLAQAPANDEFEPPVPVLTDQVEAEPSSKQSAILLGVVAALVVGAGVFAIKGLPSLGKSDSSAKPSASRTTAAPTPGTTAPAPPATPAPTEPPATTIPSTTPIPVSDTQPFSPEDGKVEGKGIVNLALDGKPETYWKSNWYGSPDYNKRKSGTGLILDLGQDMDVRRVNLVLPAAQDVSVFVTKSPTIAGAARLGGASDANGAVSISSPTAANGRYVIVWVTKAGSLQAGQFRAMISEISVLP